MVYMVGALTALLFVIAFERLQIGKVAKRVIDTARTALVIVRDDSASDADKERALQKATRQLLHSVATIGTRGFVLLLLSLTPMWIASLVGLASISEVSAWMISWRGILIVSGMATLMYMARRHLSGGGD